MQFSLKKVRPLWIFAAFFANLFGLSACSGATTPQVSEGRTINFYFEYDDLVQAADERVDVAIALANLAGGSIYLDGEKFRPYKFEGENIFIIPNDSMEFTVTIDPYYEVIPGAKRSIDKFTGVDNDINIDISKIPSNGSADIICKFDFLGSLTLDQMTSGKWKIDCSLDIK